MNLLQRIKRVFKRTASPWYALNKTPEGYWRPTDSGEVYARDVALSIPAVQKAMSLYKSNVASYPLKVYEPVTVGESKGRREAVDRPEYKLLNAKPNRLMDRPTLLKSLVDDYWWEGEAFLVARYNGLGELTDLHRIVAGDVSLVDLDPVTGEKRYHVRDSLDGRTGETRVYPTANERVVHVIREPDRYGLRGVPLLAHAAESLGLHRQILNSGKAYFRNSVRPSGWLTLEGRPNEEAVASIRKNFKEAWAGADKTGDVPALVGGKFEQFANVTAEDAQILAALASSTPTVAMLFGLHPSDLGDESQSKYATANARATDQIARVFRPLLDCFEVALNNSLFQDGQLFCEFDTDESLRGDSQAFADYMQSGLTAGYFLRSECREWLGLEPKDGMDQPLHPLNQGPELGSPDADQGQPAEEAFDLSKVTPIIDKVVSGEYPPETAKTLILLAFPQLDQSIVDVLVNVQPQPQPEVTSADQDPTV